MNLMSKVQNSLYTNNSECHFGICKLNFGYADIITAIDTDNEIGEKILNYR